jgi:hypothetical protein
MALKNLPQLNYVLFEAVKFPILTDENNIEYLGPPEQDKVLLLDRVYTAANYSYTSLSTNTKFFGEDNYLNDKGGMAPVQIRLTGTFGYEPIRRGRNIRNGFQRLKEFRDDLFKKINSVTESLVDKTLPTRKRYIYQCNFYDMIHHEFLRIDLKKFDPNADGRIHTKLHFYTINLEGIGPIVDVQGKDLLLKLIKGAIKVEEIRENVEKEIEEWIRSIPVIGDIYGFSNNMLDVFADVETTAQFANEYLSQVNAMNALYDQTLFGQFVNPFINQGTLDAFNKSQALEGLDKLRSYISII